MHRFSEFWHMRLPHRLQGQKVKSQSHGAGAYCGGHLAAQLVGNALVSINVVTLRRARLVRGWVTVFGRVNYLGI